jgi:hypothetical protein
MGPVRAVHRVALALALGLSALVLGAQPGSAQAPRAAAIDRNGVLILIRTTLVAVQQANQTGNYAVLYGISAPAFQAANSARRGSPRSSPASAPRISTCRPSPCSSRSSPSCPRSAPTGSC